MSLDSAYATAAQYRTVTGATDTAKDADILVDLKAVSRYLEGKLGRFFNKDTSDVIRVYIAPATVPALWIDDLSAAPTSIKIDDNLDGTYETTLAATDYELWPLNAAKEPEARPFTRIHLTPWGTRPAFCEGDRIQITGKFGWPAVPEAIQRATIHLAAILRIESPRATQRIPELSDVIEASPEAQHIVRQITDQYPRIGYR